MGVSLAPAPAEPASDNGWTAKACEALDRKHSDMKKPGIKPGFSMERFRSVTLVTFGQVAADAATQCAAQTCADGGASLAAQAVADHRTTGCADAATNGCFSAAAFARGDGTARCTRNAGTNRSTGAAAHALADHVAQCATQTTADSGSAITSSHRTLSNQKPKNQSRQC
jgi:hypothetical protein